MSHDAPPTRRTLDSWKEIGVFLGRDARTAQRWEKDEGLPVHRHPHHARSSVFAYPEELNAWRRVRGSMLEPSTRFGRARTIAIGTAVAVLILGLVAVVTMRVRRSTSREAPASFGLVVANGPPFVTPGSVAVSPDGETLYLSDWGANAIFSVPAKGGSPQVLASLHLSGFRGLEHARFIAISPDGRVLYVAGWNTGTVFSVSTSTGDATLLASGPPFDHPHGIAVSVDGSLIYVTDNFAGKLFRLASSGGPPKVLASNLPEPLDVIPAGSTLFVACGDGSIRAFPDNGAPPTIVAASPPLVRPTGIAVSPDRSTLYIVDDAGFGGRPPAVIYTLPVAGGSLSKLFSGPPLLFPPDLVVAPDGDGLYVADPGYGANGAAYRLDLFTPVRIAVEPRTGANQIRPYSSETVAVAILTTADFDAGQVDPESVRFGPHQAPIHDAAHFEDVNGDGKADLLLHFVLAHTGVACGDSEARLRGLTYRGIRIQGRASIQTIDCR